MRGNPDRSWKGLVLGTAAAILVCLVLIGIAYVGSQSDPKTRASGDNMPLNDAQPPNRAER
jgi:hypothetical protein